MPETPDTDGVPGCLPPGETAGARQARTDPGPGGTRPDRTLMCMTTDTAIAARRAAAEISAWLGAPRDIPGWGPGA